MGKTLLDPAQRNQHYPALTAILTAGAGGKENAMTVAWHCSISAKPPIYGVAVRPQRYTYHLVLESREFAINFLPLDQMEMSAVLGGTTGRKDNKFERFRIEKEAPLTEHSSPVLKNAHAAYVCKLLDNPTYGDHIWLVGEITAVYLDKEVYDERGVIDLNRVEPLLYLGADFYATTRPDSARHLKRGVKAR